jgi:hypothetical protein
MKLSIRTASLLALVVTSTAACREPCVSQRDCPLGFYCLEDTERAGRGSCTQDCASADDCPAPASASQVALCTNLGKCRVAERPPRLRVLSPENDTLLPDGTRTIRLTGEVETAAADAVVDVTSALDVTGCGLIPPESIPLRNAEPGRFVSLPFTTRDIAVDPGVTSIRVIARVGAAAKTLEQLVELPCVGCTRVALDVPPFPAAVAGLTLPELRGSVAPATPRVVWRVRSDLDQVIDGTAPVVDGRFQVRRVPLFTGTNRLSVSASAATAPEGRCTVTVTSGAATEPGLRVLLTWDGQTSDLDVHLVGADGRYGVPGGALSASAPNAALGTVNDVFDGFGPEVLSSVALEDGVYGVLVEPVVDNADAGSSAFVRVLWRGRLLTTTPVGPQFLSDRDQRLWVVGTVEVQGGSATWRKLDVMLDAPPTTPPSAWPRFE